MKILMPLIAIFLFAISGCYYDSKEYLYPQLTSCDTTNITYKVCIVNILDMSCVGCHSGSASSGGGIKLDSYTEVKKRVDDGKLMGSIKWTTGFKKMPKNDSKIESSSIVILEKWISAGAPNN